MKEKDKINVPSSKRPILGIGSKTHQELRQILKKKKQALKKKLKPFRED